jgi:transcription elongation GreA/GreB family factor
MMNKPEILEQIIAHLQTDVNAMKNAEQFSHSVATDKENQPKNRHDTLALESSYMAQIQSDRVNQMESVLMAYQALRGEVIAKGAIIRMSALVSIQEKGEPNQHYFIGPKTGGWAGLELDVDGECMTVITSASPIGQALLGHKTGDTIKVKIGWNERTLKISAVS